MDLKPGTRWASQVCETEIVVVRSAAQTVSLECGGHPMLPVGDARAAGLTLDPAFAEGSLTGKRLAEPEHGVEILITKAGAGSVSIEGIAMVPKVAKPLPSSD